jgi:hypothetical protein
MSKTILSLAVASWLLALGLSVEAQQSGKIPRIGVLPSGGDATNPGLEVQHSSKGCEIWVTLKGKTS